MFQMRDMYFSSRFARHEKLSRSSSGTGKLVLTGVPRTRLKQLPARPGRQDLRYQVAMKVRDPKSAGPKPLGQAEINQTRAHRLPFELLGLRTVHFAEHRSNLLLKPEALLSMLWF
jgi:hypothetical protein